MKKISIIILAMLMCLTMFTACGNKNYFRGEHNFKYAYISLPNNEVVEGEVTSWKDFEDGDQLEITINGITYLTDSTRCVLMSEKE